MSLLVALGVGWLTRMLVAGRMAERAAVAVGVGTAVAVWWPRPAGALLAAGGFAWAVRRLAGRRRRRERSRNELPLLGELLLIGLTAGLSVPGALGMAGRELGGPIGVAVEGTLREARRVGSAAALARAEGPVAGLCARLAQAQVTGAPVTAMVASFVREAREAERARLLEEAHRLPVKMVIPLALLILPGFALLALGPQVLASLQRLADPLWSSLPPVVGRMPT